MISLSYKDCPDVVEKIDCIVMLRRRESPNATYSRAKFLRDAVNRALAEFEVMPPKVRTRRREVMAPSTTA